jgi:hypothetical protein
MLLMPAKMGQVREFGNDYRAPASLEPALSHVAGRCSS